MSIPNAYAAKILDLILRGTAIADIAENDTTSPATTLTIALHTADPGETGDQTTSETAYTGYTRKTINRGTGFGAASVADPSVSALAADLDFPECTASPGGAITHFSVGTGVSNTMIISGTVTPNITMAVNVVPRLKATTTTISLD